MRRAIAWPADVTRALGFFTLGASLTALSLTSLGCDPPVAPAATDAATPAASTPSSGATASTSPADAGAPAAARAPSPWDGGMPPRPVPRSSPTVGSGMPMETQMGAIAYMAAMQEPHYDDAAADAAYAQTLAAQLKGVVASMDRGESGEKSKLDRVEVSAGGRRIDLLLATGCDAETPRRAVVTRAGTPLSTLLGHGVLVVRCNDAHVQCLQSTRDPTDVLCTTAPRHK